MKAALRDGVVADRDPGGIIRSAMALRRSANGKNGRAGAARRKGPPQMEQRYRVVVEAEARKRAEAEEG
jgi:hypothetical protein